MSCCWAAGPTGAAAAPSRARSASGSRPPATCRSTPGRRPTRIPSMPSCRWSSRPRATAACAGSSPSCCTIPTRSTTSTWRARAGSSPGAWSCGSRSNGSMVEALVFLAAAVICVPLARRLGLGAVLGYLIAGAAIGPWGLKLIEGTESTRNLAELGVVLMLFVIGLELDPRRFLAMRGVVFGGGFLQLAASGAVLGVALWLAGLTWQAALIGGLSLALSSTAIAMQALTERNELDTPTGQASFAILLFQDIAAIPLIALVP